MLTITRLLAIALCVAAIPAAAQSVHTDYDHHADFSRFHTFCVDRVHSADPLYEGRMRDALNYTLSHTTLRQAGGTLRTRTDPGPAPVEVQAGCDLAVRAVGSVREQQEYSTFYNGFGPGWGYGGWGGPGFGYGYGGGFGGFGGYGGGPSVTRVEQIPIGTLVVDVYDTRTKHLVFRGIATQQVSHHADKNTRRLNIAVEKMFKKFPPKSDS
ncbi:MAG: DUF4136 domain-containing protein [Janthinobacterium lividum]